VLRSLVLGQGIVGQQVRDALKDFRESLRDELEEHRRLVAQRVERHEQEELEAFKKIDARFELMDERMASFERRRTEQEKLEQLKREKGLA
jgi:hypothetical protein